MRASLHRVSAYAGRCKLTQRQGPPGRVIPAGKGQSWESWFVTFFHIFSVFSLSSIAILPVCCGCLETSK